jgi:hypothetical protein
LISKIGVLIMDMRDPYETATFIRGQE